MPDSQQKARRTTRLGAIVFVASIALMTLPVVIHLGGIAKYLVAMASIGALAGISIVLNGAIDLWRGK